MVSNHDAVWIEFDGWEYQESLAQELERSITHLQENLAALLYDDEELEEEFETPSGMPYCGCPTCDAREILCTIVPLVAGGVESGRMRRPADKPGITLITTEDPHV